ncbi:unnamed protein product [Arctogadus glacialis]
MEMSRVEEMEMSRVEEMEMSRVNETEASRGGGDGKIHAEDGYMMEGSEWTGTGRGEPVLRRSEEEEMALLEYQPGVGHSARRRTSRAL